MAAQVYRHYRVFVASPRDVQEERQAVSKIIQKVNKTLGEEKGIFFKEWLWDIDAVPAAGHPQDVINPDLDKADIGVFILWNRIGTPRGTQEEFRRVYERWKTTKSPQIMIYRCVRPATVSDMDDEDFEQVMLLRKFLKEHETEVLIQEFSTTDEFEEKLFEHLVRWQPSNEVTPTPVKVEPTSKTISKSDHDAYLEHVRNVCGSIVLTGLLREKAAAAVPLEEVYVSLNVTRTDLSGAVSNKTASYRGAISLLGNYLRIQEQLPDALNPELAQLLMQALEEIGVKDRDEDTVKMTYRRIQTEAKKSSSTKQFSTQAVREILRTFNIEDAFHHAQYLLVEGVPGSGKTTILMRVAMALVEAHCGQPQSAEAMGFKKPYPLPLFVPLRYFWTYLRSLKQFEVQNAGAQTFYRFILKAIRQYVTEDDWFLPTLQRGELALLLDGLDEIPDSIARRRTADIIRDFVQKYRQCQVALTSRPAGLTIDIRNSLVNQGRLAHCEVRPLDQDQIRRFIHAWYKALIPNQRESQRQADDLLKRINANPRVAELASSPILLTAIAIVHQTLGDLPERRADLYDHCVKALCSRWEHSKFGEDIETVGKYSLIESFSEHNKLRMFEKIAFTIHGQGGNAKTIERGPLLNIISKSLPSDQSHPLTIEQSSQVLVDIVDRTGLIIPDGDFAYRFRHLSFQEFLAARHIIDQVDNAIKELAPRLADPWWREVVQLAPAFKAMYSQVEARKLLTDLADYIREKADAEFRASAFGTIARALLDLKEFKIDRLDEIAKKIEPDLLKTLDDPSQPGEPRIRAIIAECLGRFVDPRLTDENRWLVIPAGEYWRKHFVEDMKEPRNDGDWIFISEFRIQRWMVTVSEYRLFIEANGYDNKRWWSDKGWSWLIDEPNKTPLFWEDQLERAGNNPVTGVSFWEAAAYCRWYSMQRNGLPDKWVVRLPTEAEWEKSARGGKVLSDNTANDDPFRNYPWGSVWDDRHANTSQGDWLLSVTSVGCYPKGNSPYGTWDQSGNVWEWCLDWHDPFAYRRPERRDPVIADEQSVPKVTLMDSNGKQIAVPCRVTKGGSYNTDDRHCQITYRYRFPSSKRLEDMGFRCAGIMNSRTA